jgi:hypothetical protein
MDCGFAYATSVLKTKNNLTSAEFAVPLLSGKAYETNSADPDVNASTVLVMDLEGTLPTGLLARQARTSKKKNDARPFTAPNPGLTPQRKR